MSSGIVYVLTNQINGKQYVGQTVKTLEQRFNEHLWCVRQDRGYYIHAAIRKHGEHAFQTEVLEECDVELLDERERFWIAQLKTLWPGGYNLTEGGETGILCEEAMRRRVASLRQTVQKPSYRERQSRIQRVAHNRPEVVDKHRSKAFEQWSRPGFREKMRKIHRSVEHRTKLSTAKARYKKPVEQYDSLGMIVNVFESISSAAEAVNGQAIHISNCARGKARTAYGYTWKFQESE